MSRFMQRGRRRLTGRRRRERGQTLVEFALVLPLFMLLLAAVIEFGFLIHSFLTINVASREASLVAAQAGDADQADCLILNAIEENVGAPSNRELITTVEIFRADSDGNKTGAVTTYVRGGGSKPCRAVGVPPSLPYSLSTGGYPSIDRCNRVGGCGTPTGVDQVGVEVTYEYAWHIGLFGVFGTSSGTTLNRSNVMRMEPVL